MTDSFGWCPDGKTEQRHTRPQQAETIDGTPTLSFQMSSEHGGLCKSLSPGAGRAAGRCEGNQLSEGFLVHLQPHGRLGWVEGPLCADRCQGAQRPRASEDTRERGQSPLVAYREDDPNLLLASWSLRSLLTGCPTEDSAEGSTGGSP